MKRVVITGMGIVSCLGNTLEDVTDSLREGKSGIKPNKMYNTMGLRSGVSGKPDIDIKKEVPSNILRFMGDTASYAYIALRNAIEDSNLEESDISNPRTGLIMGSSAASAENQGIAGDIMTFRGTRGVGPYRVIQTMNSTVSGNLATIFKIKGVSYSISSACTTSLHNIGAAYEQIQFGKQDVMFAGGSEEDHWTIAGLLDIASALSAKGVSCPYDKDRDGFVIAGGGGAVVLEEYEHAKARGAKIYGEIVGYGATSDGSKITAPTGEGAKRAMELAIQDVDKVDYINAHGTSTVVGDIIELRAIKEVFGDDHPYISSTKSLSGHSMGGAGVQEFIYCTLMLNNQFMAGTANITNLDPRAEGYNILRERKDAPIETILTNSFGFGGTNGSLVIKKT